MGRYEEALKSLNTAQRQAVETTDGPVLVIAGPGTGKTQLLTTRIAHILAKTDTLPQNILCLTFTDSAAQTMRERLTGMIGQGAHDVSISTYHAFGSELIRRFPDYFADQVNLEPIDDLGIDQILREIVNNLPYSNPLKYSDAYLGDIKTLISDAKRALLTPDNLRAVANENLGFIKEASKPVGEILDGLARIDKKALPLFEELAKRAALFQQGTQPKRSRKSSGETQGSPEDFTRVSGSLLEKSSKLSAQFLSSLEEAIAEAEAAGKTTPLTAWKNTWLAKDHDGQFIVDGTKNNQKLLAAADVYEAYLNELKARSLFDYDDMILRAVHALETNNDLRYSLQEQYLYILLDEFQDTNGAQLRLVELLTDNPVNEGRPNVLAVGDDDQAIYAFQGADYSHMLRFKDMYNDVLVVPLTENYRSHPDILHTARGIAEQIEERLHHHFPQIEKTLTASGRDLPKEAVVERREAKSDVMQFAWVAARIRDLIARGMAPSEIAVLAPQHKYLEPLVPFLTQDKIPVRYDKRENVLDDPAINQLLRMSELALALGSGDQKRANALWPQALSFDFWELPTSLVWNLSWRAADDDHDWTNELLDDPKLKPIALFFLRLGQLSGTETLERMLDYIIGSQPLDLNEPGYDAFTSPYYEHYFGELDEELIERATPSDSGTELTISSAPGDRSRAEIVQLSLESQLANSGSTSVESPESEEMARKSAKKADFWNLLTNLIVLRARLREYRKDGDARLTIGDFIEFVEAHRAAELKILNTSPYASGSNAVQLMTAFKAKGMEFETVFVLAANDEAWGNKARTQSTRISLPPNLQFIRYAGATEDERLRLFYVAITRAKSQLYLVNYTQNYAGKQMTRLKYLNESPDEEGKIPSPLLPASKQLVLPAEDSTPAPTTELAAYWQRRHEHALGRADMRALLQQRLTQFQLSATHINDFTDLATCGPRDFFLRTILRFPRSVYPEQEYGQAMHETMEWLHNHFKQNGALPTAAAIHKTFSHRLATKSMTAHDEKLYAQRGKDALSAYLAQRADTISTTATMEVNFRREGAFAGKAHLTGKIDKLIIDKEAKTVTIVEFKTGKSYTRWTRDVKMHKYRHQLYLYRALIEGSHTFANYQVAGAYIEFIEPDENGEIRELHLQFDDKEYARVKRLAEAIWNRLQAVDLPDVEAYSKDLAGIEAFEADLIAG